MRTFSIFILTYFIISLIELLICYKIDYDPTIGFIFLFGFGINLIIAGILTELLIKE